MHDVKEVYRVVTQQAPPKPDALERQRKRQMRHTMRRRIGAFAVAAAIVGLALFAILTSVRDGGRQPATSTVPSATVTGVPEVDYVIDLNTGEMTPLPKAIIRSLGVTSKSGQYAVAPGPGSLLAYVGTGDDWNAQIFIAGRAAGGSPGIDGTPPRQVTHDPIGATSPAWSPDGTRIAYVGHGGGDARNLFVLDVATGESTQITNGTHVLVGERLQFTPDGSSLLYTGGSNQSPELRTVPVAGGKSTLLIGQGGGMADTGTGSLSPDGSLVTFLGSEVGGPGPGMWVANADGTERRSLPGCESNPAGTWSPDGNRIVCGDWRRNVIIVVDIATGNASRVADGTWAIWLDRHTLLVEV
jgi:Tol biopolymer transport system component